MVVRLLQIQSQMVARYSGHIATVICPANGYGGCCWLSRTSADS